LFGFFDIFRAVTVIATDCEFERLLKRRILFIAVVFSFLQDGFYDGTDTVAGDRFASVYARTSHLAVLRSYRRRSAQARLQAASNAEAATAVLFDAVRSRIGLKVVFAIA